MEILLKNVTIQLQPNITLARVQHRITVLVRSLLISELTFVILLLPWLGKRCLSGQCSFSTCGNNTNSCITCFLFLFLEGGTE